MLVQVFPTKIGKAILFNGGLFSTVVIIVSLKDVVFVSIVIEDLGWL